VWAVVASYGGGLVAGDDVCLEVDVEEGATALLGTQAETKVYRSWGAPCRLDLRARVGAGATLVVLPDPVSCFSGARYRQIQRFDVAAGGTLLLVDTLVAGRAARGERWAFDEYSGRNEVTCGGRLVLADALRLSRSEGPAVAARMGDIDLLATVVGIGPRIAAHTTALLSELGRLPADAGAGVLVAASPLALGIHLRLAARSVEAGLGRLRAVLAFLPEILGDDPFSRRP
jgi:urease accessory protein